MTDQSYVVSVRGLFEESCSAYTTTWPALTEHLRRSSLSIEHVREALPLFNFTRFDGAGVRKENAQEVSAVMLDYDGTTHEQFQAIVAQARHCRGFAYTSYNHEIKGEPPCRFRIGLALDKPAPAGAWDTLWHRVSRLLGVVSPTAPDKKTRDPGRFFYLPAQNPKGPPAWFDAWDGPELPTDLLLVPDQHTPVPMMIESELEQWEMVSLPDANNLAKRLEGKQDPEHKALGRALQAGLRGLVFAAPGDRNDVAYKMAGELAKAFPRASADGLAEHMRASLEQQGEPTTETFAGMIRRHQLRVQQLAQEKRSLRAFGQAAFAAPPDAPVAEAVIAGLPLMVQKDGFYWCRETTSADYREVYGSKDIRLAIFRKYPGAIDLNSAEGTPLALDHLLLTYSNVVRDVQANYLSRENTYEPEHARLTLATAPLRPLQPAYDPQVDTWLRALGGRCYEDIAAWIQGLFQLDRPSPALYMWGESGAGKTLLAYGLAQLWQHPLTTFASVIDSFNAPLAKCPFVLADEGFPPETKFTWLRAFLSESTREVNEKFRPHYTLKGHVRLYVTANNPAAFEFGRKYLTAQDAAAIGERVIQIETRREATRYLESLGDVRPWVHQQVIAQHALWIRDQPAVANPGRWAVTSKHADKNSFESSLVDARYAWFVAWLAAYLQAPRVVEGRFNEGNPDGWLVRTMAGRLLVSADAYRYIDRCEASEFKAALRFFSRGDRVRERVPGNAHRLVTYREIDVPRFYNSARDHVDAETFHATLAIDSADRVRATMGR